MKRIARLILILLFVPAAIYVFISLTRIPSWAPSVIRFPFIAALGWATVTRPRSRLVTLLAIMAFVSIYAFALYTLVLHDAVLTFGPASSVDTPVWGPDLVETVFRAIGRAGLVFTASAIVLQLILIPWEWHKDRARFRAKSVGRLERMSGGFS